MTVLLLAGTGEAVRIAHALAARGTDALVWPDPTARLSNDWPLPICSNTLQECLARPELSAVLDATHPFAMHLSHKIAHTCASRELPYCLLLRPEWRAEPNDRWTVIASEADAPAHIEAGSTVFLATGREGLPHFANLKDCYIYCRQIGGTDALFPMPNGEFLIQHPPFSVEEELTLFRRLRIDWLVLRNSGSTRADTKLIAARQLGLRVLMISRPAPPDAPVVTTIEEALTWAQHYERQNYPQR